MNVIESYRVSCLDIAVLEEDGVLKYEVREPALDELGLNKVKVLIENVFSKKASFEKVDLKRLAEEGGLSEEEEYHLQKRVSPYGQLYPLLLDENVLEVSVLSPDKPAYVRHRHFLKNPYIRTNVKFEDEREYEMFVERVRGRLAEYGDGRFYEGPLDENLYANLVLQRSPYHSFCIIRRRMELGSSMLIGACMSPQEIAYLWTMLEIKTTIAVTGSTREHRRSVLNELVQLIPKKARVMVVENTATTVLPQEYLIRVHAGGREHFRKVFELAQRNDIEYTILEAEEADEGVRVPSTRTCFIYTRQTPLASASGMQAILNISNSVSSDRIGLVEEFGEHRVEVSFEEYEEPEKVFEGSRILQHWAKVNHYSREKVVEALSLKVNYVLYLREKRLGA